MRLICNKKGIHCYNESEQNEDHQLIDYGNEEEVSRGNINMFHKMKTRENRGNKDMIS